MVEALARNSSKRQLKSELQNSLELHLNSRRRDIQSNDMKHNDTKNDTRQNDNQQMAKLQHLPSYYAKKCVCHL
jgi:hypothetical protein